MDFALLLKRVSPKLKGITHKLNGHFTFFNDEDLYQEALVYLWQNFRGGGLSDKTDSYILQGCYFYLKNYLRKSKAYTKLLSIETIINDAEDRSLEGALFLQESDARLFFERLDNKLLAEDIQNNGLTKREKDILGFFSAGLTTRQIGEKIGISHVRVVKLLGRIRVKCRKYTDGKIK